MIRYWIARKRKYGLSGPKKWFAEILVEPLLNGLKARYVLGSGCAALRQGRWNIHQVKERTNDFFKWSQNWKLSPIFIRSVFKRTFLLTMKLGQRTEILIRSSASRNRNCYKISSRPLTTCSRAINKNLNWNEKYLITASLSREKSSVAPTWLNVFSSQLGGYLGKFLLGICWWPLRALANPIISLFYDHFWTSL